MGEINNTEAEKAQQREKFEKGISERLGHFFDQQPDPEERTEQLLRQLQLFSQDEMWDERQISKPQLLEMIEKTRAAARIAEREKFISAVIEALKPLLDFNFEHREQYEEMERRAFFINFDRLSKVLGYDVGPDNVAIHFAPSRTLKMKEIQDAMSEGLKELAKRLAGNNLVEIVDETNEQTGEITKKRLPVDSSKIIAVTAASDIIKTNPHLIEHYGFKVGEDSPAQAANYPEETVERPKWAAMSKEDFLRLYGEIG